MEIKLCTPERINGINATVDRASLEALSSLALVLLGLGGSVWFHLSHHPTFLRASDLSDLRHALNMGP